MKRFLVLLVFIAILLSACTPSTPVAPTDVSVTPVACVKVESDNQFSWSSGSCVNTNTQVYTVTIKVDGEMKSHSETNAEAYGFAINGTGTYSSRMWQDGKGILPAEIMALSPDFHDLAIGDHILLKTSDLKAMALPPGAQATFICNEDVEVLSPTVDFQRMTTDRQTYELDDCRMVTPEYQ